MTLSRFIKIDIKSPVVFIIPQPAKEIKGRSCSQGMGIGSREKHYSWLVFSRALQIVEDIMGADIWKNFSNPGDHHGLKL